MVILAGWASNSKYALLGGLRIANQFTCNTVNTVFRIESVMLDIQFIFTELARLESEDGKIKLDRALQE
jgi:NADH:ubiquinone oxidoreductase subunit H